jgi:hypothetical protein
MRNKKRQSSAREVIRVIPSAEVTRWMIPDTSDMAIEVRQRRDKSYTIHYPEEGWLPCTPQCNLRHKHSFEHPYTESYYSTTSLDDALEHARFLAGNRPVKVIKWTPPAKRKRLKPKEKD